MKPLKLKTTKKLEIKRETLRTLTDTELQDVNGAGRVLTSWCSSYTMLKCGAGGNNCVWE